MSMIPGISSQPSEFADGMKVNTISELTATNGVQLQGRTSGVAIEAGKVGYWIQAAVNAVASVPPGGRYFVTDSLTLTAGAWEIVFVGRLYITTPSLNGWVTGAPAIYNTTDAADLFALGGIVDSSVTAGGVHDPDSTFAGAFHLSIPVNISSTKIFQGVMYAAHSSSQIGVVTNYNTGKFYAKRIA